MSTNRPLRVTRDVVGDRQEPREDRVAVKLDLVPSPPCLEKDDARQILSRRPRAGQTKTMVIDSLRVALEEFTECCSIVSA